MGFLFFLAVVALGALAGRSFASKVEAVLALRDKLPPHRPSSTELLIVTVSRVLSLATPGSAPCDSRDHQSCVLPWSRIF